MTHTDEEFDSPESVSKRLHIPLPTDTDEEFDSPESLSKRLHIPLPTIYAWRAKGTGPKSMKVGKHLRYRRTDVESWLDELAGEKTASRTA